MAKIKTGWTEGDLLCEVFERSVKSISEGPPPKDGNQYFVRRTLYETKRVLFACYLKRLEQLLYDSIPPNNQKPIPSNMSIDKMAACLDEISVMGANFGPHFLKLLKKVKEYDPTDAMDSTMMVKIHAIEKKKHIDEDIAIKLIKESQQIIYRRGKCDGYWIRLKEREQTAHVGWGTKQKNARDQQEMAISIINKKGFDVKTKDGKRSAIAHLQQKVILGVTEKTARKYVNEAIKRK